MIPAAPIFVTYTGDGTTTVFHFDKRIYLAADLQVWTYTPGVDTVPQQMTSGFTVAVDNDFNGASATLAVAPALGVKIGLIRRMDLTQDINISNTDYVPPSVVEQQIDRQVMMAQEAALFSTLQLKSDPFGFTQTARANGVPVFDAFGNQTFVQDPFPMRGVWSSATSYSYRDVITRSGTAYISRITPNLNIDPATDNGSNWQILGGDVPLDPHLISWAEITRVAAFDAFAASGLLGLANGGTGGADAPTARLNLSLSVRVASVAALQALDTTKDTAAYLTVAGRRFHYAWTAGNFSAQITAADPRYIASSANPTGSSGAWVQNGSVQTGQFFQTLGAQVHYLADRVFMGAAVENYASPVASQPDWLTTFQIGTGRTNGFIEFAQTAILTNSNSNSANALVAGAETSTLAGLGNSIGVTAVGVNNNSSFTNGAFGLYAEAYRMSGALGGATGLEIDTVNYASVAIIDPYAQAANQTIGLQLAAGAALSGTGQFAASAAINIQNNNSNFQRGIIFGHNAIAGTAGNDGGRGIAIAMATGHQIMWYVANGSPSWNMTADVGTNGNFIFSTAGTGALASPKLLAGTGLATPGAALTITNNAAALPAGPSGTIAQIGAVDGASARLLLDTFGTSVPPILTMRTARGTAAAPTASQQSDQLLNIGAIGYGATGYAGGQRVNILGVAAENWTDAAQGTQIAFNVTPTGSVTPFTAMSILGTGQVTSTGGFVSSSGGVGYATGAGGAVTQATSRTTGVTLNKTSGDITLFSAAGSATATTFTVTNSTVGASDTVVVNQKSGSNLYNCLVTAVAAGSFNITFFTTGGTATDAPVFHYNVIKGVNA